MSIGDDAAGADEEGFLVADTGAEPRHVVEGHWHSRVRLFYLIGCGVTSADVARFTNRSDRGYLLERATGEAKGSGG